MFRLAWPHTCARCISLGRRDPKPTTLNDPGRASLYVTLSVPDGAPRALWCPNWIPLDLLFGASGLVGTGVIATFPTWKSSG